MLHKGSVVSRRLPIFSRNQHRTVHRALMLPQEPTWATVGLFSAGSVALGAIATASIINALNRRSSRSVEPQAKRQKLAPPSPEKSPPPELAVQDAAVDADQDAAAAELQAEEPPAPAAEPSDEAPGTPEAEPHSVPHSDSVVDLQKLQELEQRVADLNALAELGKVYQDSLALSAQLRNLSSFRLQQDKVLGRGSLAVVQEGEYAGDSVAVKLLPIGSVFAEDSRKEACLALCLHHPNIVRVVGVHLVEVEAKPYLALVQETAPGGDLGWQIEDCDFHTGRRGSASMDVAIKLLLDAARGLAYMHDVDVVHGDVKSRNLLVFWEEDEQSDTEENDNQSDKVMGDSSDAPPAGTTPADAAAAAAGGGSGSQAGDKVLVWGLKWCDFGVSFRAAEAPGGICKTVTGTPGFRAPEVMDIGWSKAADTYAYGVIAWQLLTGEKPIVYDREWRMHVPNPDLLRVDRTGGVEEVPKPLADLVWDCGSYNAKDRPSMREVVQRLEDLALQRLQKQEAAEAEQARQEAAEQAAEAKAAADAQAAAEQQQQQREAAAEQQHQQHKEEAAAKPAAVPTAAIGPTAAATAATAVDGHAATCPTCNQPSPLPGHGYGGLARAMSVAAREAAAGGAAADAHYQQLLQKEAAAAGGPSRASFERQPSRRSIDGFGPSRQSLDGAANAANLSSSAFGRSLSGRHHYEVLIQNDDDPITAEAVAHTLEQYEGSSFSSRVLAGHPHALQLQHQQGLASASTLQHCATAPVHSHLLDTAAEAAAAAVAAGDEAAAAAPTAGNGPAVLRQAHSTVIPSSPSLNITGAVSRSNIELLPAHGPGLVRVPASPSAAAAAAGPSSILSPSAAAAAAGGSSAAAGGSGAPSGWYLASGSSFKKGMWLEKLIADTGTAGSPRSPAAAAAGGTADASHALPVDHSSSSGAPLSPTAAAAGGASSVPSASAFGSVPMSPGAAAWLQSPGSHRAERSLPDAAAVLPGSFSLQLRREPTTTTLPAVAEDDQHEGSDSDLGHPAAAGAAAAAAGKLGSTPQDGTSAGPDSAAARLLRRQHTTRRLGTDVLAAAGALSKALSAFSSASQTLPIANAAAAGSPDAAAAAAGVVGSNLLLTQDFVAAARGLSEALAALLPSAAALADVAPDQGAAAAAAASEAVQGLKNLQGQIKDAAAAAAAAAGPRQQAAGVVHSPLASARQFSAAAAAAAPLGDSRESAFAAPASQFAEPASKSIDIPTSPNGTHHSAAAVAAAAERRRTQDQAVPNANPSTAPPAVGDGMVSRSINLGSLFSSVGTSYGSSLGTGLSRRHSVDGARPSFALGAAGTHAAAAEGGVDASEPVLLRMPSIRQRKSLLSEELSRE